MTIPVLVLLAFAGWTLLTLTGSVGVYRWSRILTGRASVAEWRADVPQGSDWYQRAMRAHMNCVENLPVYSAIVVALMATGVHSSLIDSLAIAMLATRIAQTTVHIALPPTEMAASARFALFFVQVICMTAMGVIAAVTAIQ
ncbi:MAG: MAPEG family protein [Bradyrhizobium sp.]|uniref:MAPEG family protein n=1 Tax=Bradyrhizobium sp. TaxID=376 RepID=UPI002A2CC801|nr:MAPEG family protein [Bradyrhizobium sp.]